MQDFDQMSFRLPSDLRKSLDLLAAENFRTTSDEIRLALSRWVNPDAVRDRNGGK